MLAFCCVSYDVFFQMKSLLNSPGFGITGSSGWKTLEGLLLQHLKIFKFCRSLSVHSVLDSTMTWEKVIKSQERRQTEISLFDFIKKHHSFVGAEAGFGWSEAVSAVIPSCWLRCSFYYCSYCKFSLQNN